jgi:RNA polymerase sigma-70 factor (ECF subfamily)
LYEAYFPVVQRYITLFEPTREHLDELTQDIFIKVWEKRERLSGVGSFKDYLFLMVRNTVFNYFRAMKVRPPMKELGDVDVPVSEDSEALLLYKQYYRIVVEAMGKLPVGRQKILAMTIDRGLSLDEIAEELKISKSGVKKQLYAATAYVRDYLKEHGEMSVLLFVFLSLFDM